MGTSDRPAAFADTRALRACWHPVAFAAALTDRPMHADLLGEPLVLWRGPGGRPRALSDLCVHRGTALSLGWVDGRRAGLRLPRLALRRRRAVRRDPAAGGPRPGPGQGPGGGLRGPGAVRADLGRPRSRPGGRCPRCPSWRTDDWAVVSAGPYRWECDAARQVENFTDFGHFPWVHPGLLGDPARPVVPRHEVRTEGHVLHYSIVRPEAENSEEFPVFGNEQAGPPERRSRYELHLPYTIALRLGWGGERGMVYFFASQPESADRCTGLRRDRPQLQPGPARPGHPGVRGHHLRPGPGGRGVAAARARPVRPGRRAAPQVRRGGRRLPQGHARGLAAPLPPPPGRRAEADRAEAAAAASRPGRRRPAGRAARG